MKRLVFLLFLMTFLAGFPAGAAVVGDFTGDGAVDLNDAVLMLSWYLKSKPTDSGVVLTKAKAIMPTVSGSMTRFPDITDDLNGDGNVDLSDVVLLLSWYLKSKINDNTLVETKARGIMPTLSGGLQKFPGLESGSSSVPLTITGITSGEPTTKVIPLSDRSK